MASDPFATQTTGEEELILPPPSCWFADSVAAASKRCGLSSSPSSKEQPFLDKNQQQETKGKGQGEELIDMDYDATNEVSCREDQSYKGGNGGGVGHRNRARCDSGMAAAAAPDNTITGCNHQKNTLPWTSFLSSQTPALSAPCVVAAPSPSWKEISSQVLPSAAKEFLSSSLQRICYTARLSYSIGRWQRKYSDMGNNSGGYFRPDICANGATHANNAVEARNLQVLADLPPFSDLPWIDRQMVREWRTYLPEGDSERGTPVNKERILEDDDEFDRARTLVPQPMSRPDWQKSEICHACRKPFGPTRLRHHCRLCGYSFCQLHSQCVHRLPHLGYNPDVPERVCDLCKRVLLAHGLAERVAWRLARCRDLRVENLTPYFETGIDTVEEAALRIAVAALATARSIPLGAQAHVAVETVEVLRKHGLNGIYGIMLRKEFLAAADLLQKALGINKTAWPLSVHELSAAIFYALAQHRAMRGINPEREEIIHTLINDGNDRNCKSDHRVGDGNMEGNIAAIVIDETDEYDATLEQLSSLTSTLASYENTGELSCTFMNGKLEKNCMTFPSPSWLPFTPVCRPVPIHVLNSLIYYAPVALVFIYANKEVDMQLAAAQQNWKLLYACCSPEKDGVSNDMPASAIFVQEKWKIACLAVRGTATIHDVVTDVRQTPVPFPERAGSLARGASLSDGWTKVATQGNGLAVCGMASAAMNLFREHIDVILHLMREGYRIRLAGHSLGGGVATLLGVLILKELEQAKEQVRKLWVSLELSELLRVYAYGSPSTVDADLAEFTESFVTTAVLHDDVVPRLTPTSCRGLLKHLLHIRETWVKAHLATDLLAIGERARLAWAPRWRSGFTLTRSSKLSLKSSSLSIRRYCQNGGAKQLRRLKGKSVHTDNSVKVVTSVADEGKEQPIACIHRGAAARPSKAGDKKEVSSSRRPCDDSTTKTLEPSFLVDLMGGTGKNAHPVVIDGDEFFEADETLIEAEEESVTNAKQFVGAFAADGSKKGHAEGDKSGDNGIPSENMERERAGNLPSDEEDDEGRDAVLLEEMPLPRMFIPGRIVHVYSHRGCYKAVYVPRAFRELRRISLAGNMLADHTTTRYYEGLLEVRTVRHAEELPPRWTAFDEVDMCSCCVSRFTWASTSSSPAAEARDKHNCRSCGTLVCDPCSQHRTPLPTLGLMVPVRVCDRCYNDSGASTMTDSLMERKGSLQGQLGSQNIQAHSRPERQRERRSRVVDDLAAGLRIFDGA